MSNPDDFTDPGLEHAIFLFNDLCVGKTPDQVTSIVRKAERIKEHQVNLQEFAQFVTRAAAPDFLPDNFHKPF